MPEIVDDARPLRRVAQARQDRVGAALLRPSRQRAHRDAAAGRVRVDVQRHVHAFLDGVVHGFHELFHPAGVAAIRAEVRQVERYSRPARDLERLDDATAPVGPLRLRKPGLAHKDPSGVPDRLAQLHELLGRAPGARVVARPGRESQRAVLHALPDETFRAVHERSDERDVPEAGGLQPYRAVGNEVRGVDGHPSVVVLSEGRDGAHVEVRGRLAQQSAEPASIDEVVSRRQWGVRHAVDSQHLGRDALTQAIGVLRVDQQRALGVRMGVDEPGRDDEARGVDHASCVGLRQIADRRDPVAGDAHVGPIRRRPGAIHHAPVGYHYVEHGVRSTNRYRAVNRR